MTVDIPLLSEAGAGKLTTRHVIFIAKRSDVRIFLAVVLFEMMQVKYVDS